MQIKKDSVILMSDTKKISHIINPSLYVPSKASWIKRNIVKYKGQYYYRKKVTSNELINELLGSYLSKRIGLDSVDYEICIDDNYNLYVLSKVFYEKENKYYKVYELGYDTYYMYDNKIKDDNIFSKVEKYYSKELLNELLKMIVLDIKMMQTDRNASNITFKLNDHGYQLSKVYDFGEAYGKTFSFYYNPFIILFMNENDLKKLIKEYPIILHYISEVNKISIGEALDAIEKRFNIKLAKDEMNYYQEKDKEITKLLKM